MMEDYSNFWTKRRRLRLETFYRDLIFLMMYTIHYTVLL